MVNVEKTQSSAVERPNLNLLIIQSCLEYNPFISLVRNLEISLWQGNFNFLIVGSMEYCCVERFYEDIFASGLVKWEQMW